MPSGTGAPMGGIGHFSIASLIVSTIAFFVAAYFVRRKLDEIGIEKGMTRNIAVLVVALAISYAVGYVVDMIAG
ncbi:MAG TPA: hypothetical protein VN667_05045 [Burkholderiales bacterium]|nr:hypothetical protein [Burkholderiales bacterium]